ncbi:glycosyltransferase family 4 protein [Methylomonas rivi]|uniref:Glycosyltransferase family 4 protein n=1 Tax=Methylomonas rivi TaxID=2952226 RepID=A0ABT1U854_9GAMM|nr:glycosyltransferase family 4 protein [Methylomonas sp. WSC-6]MCQ8130036.1 glycosyltransferase family 4 protein [Methylomonas sp. WSC-6]
MNLCIPVSNLVAQFLECELSIPKENIYKISSFSGELKQQSNKQTLRNSLNIPDKAFVVYASGNIHWIKGTDVFIQLAAQVKKTTDTNIYFIWVGGCEHSEYMTQLLYDISHLSLVKTVKITGQLEEPWPYYAASDLFVLTSREDAFPQVALEAAMLGIPCVCFDGVSGVRDFINDKTGSLVPYLDIEQMANEIIYYYKNPDILTEKGNNIRRAVDFYTFKHTGNQFYDAFRKVVNKLVT